MSTDRTRKQAKSYTARVPRPAEREAEPHVVSDDEAPSCPVCPDGGYAIELGTLGKRTHYRCRNCGVDFSRVTP